MVYIDRHKEHDGLTDVTQVFDYINAHGDISTELTTIHPDVLSWVRSKTGKTDMSEETAARIIWQAVLDHMQYPGSDDPEDNPDLLGFIAHLAGSSSVYLFLGPIDMPQNNQTIKNAIDALQGKTQDELCLLIAGWNSNLPNGFTLEDWEEAMVMAKATSLIDGNPLLSITYQLLIIYRRYRDAENRPATASVTHSPTQTER